MKTAMTVLILTLLFASSNANQIAQAAPAKYKTATTSVAPNPELAAELVKSADGAILKNAESGEMLSFVHGQAGSSQQRQQRAGTSPAVISGKLSQVTEASNLSYALVSMSARSKVKSFDDTRDITDLNDVTFLVNTELNVNTVSAKVIIHKFNLSTAQYQIMLNHISTLATGKPGTIVTLGSYEFGVIANVVRLLLNDEDKSVAVLYAEKDLADAE